MTIVTKLCRNCLCLAVVFAFYAMAGARLSAASTAFGTCNDTCGSGTDCSETCIDENANTITCGDFGQCNDFSCSDNCSPVTSCDFNCYDGGWTDCGDYNGGQANAECDGVCGDGVCDANRENHSNCPADCPPAICDGGVSCSVEEQDCSDGGICVDSCCLLTCEDTDTCGDEDDQPRSCMDAPVSCTFDSDCCEDEMCVDLSAWNGSSFLSTPGPICVVVQTAS
jgi:hypothetical protein